MSPAEKTGEEPADAEEGLAQWMASIARELATEPDVPATVQRLVDLAVKTVDGAEYAGITVASGANIETPAEHGQVPRQVDDLQARFGEGPCIDAIRDHEVYETGDLAKEDRWPRFAPAVVEQTEIRSILSMRLFVTEEGTIGALNLYSTACDAFDAHDRALAAVFAAHAAVAVRAATTADQLQGALGSRDLIGQAKGLLMARGADTADEAFELLKKVSQQQNRKLRDVAADVVEHRDEL